ncbi:hypothetical protein B0T17DRAFT_577537 [Bombardia bombarda]|uniref:GST N-terminal domain-containing protein n=1 Tax=Bombardia bombarda TaxID=252184 RepID=A0AA39X0A9_9PEZI|nr:hypothetical protein B0T17DRAFT_577537 [Bombardia bombarda]
MAEEQPIILFDLPSQPPCTCWSYNPWKTRFLLNYKGLNYKTEWLEYPNIKPRLKDHVPPVDIYTIPTVLLPSGKYIMDSRAIADHLEAQHPSPPLHLDSPYLARVNGILPRFMTPLRAIIGHLIPLRILNDASLPYWYETRASPEVLEERYRTGKQGEATWEAVAPAVAELTALLKENPEGPFFMGKEVSYADFVWGGFLIFCRRVGEDVFEGSLKGSGEGGRVHRELLEALKPWSGRDGY